MSRTVDCVLAGNLTLAIVIWFLARSWLYFTLRCRSVFVFNIPLPSLAFHKNLFVICRHPHSSHWTSVFIDGVDSNKSLLEYRPF